MVATWRDRLRTADAYARISSHGNVDDYVHIDVSFLDAVKSGYGG